MTAFQGSLIILGGVSVTILFLALSSLSQSLIRYVEAYERAVDAACSGTPYREEQLVAENNSLQAGVYHATPEDLHEYFRGRAKMNDLANTRPTEYADDFEYEFSERRL